MVAHWKYAAQVIAYLLSSKDHVLRLGGDKHALEGWVDADYAGCYTTAQSTTGYLFKFCGSTIQWQSKRQDTVAQSTLEAEYTATAEAAREAIWLRSLLKELGFSQGATKLNCDNQGAIQLAYNPGTHARSKHVDVQHHYIWEQVQDVDLWLKYIQSESQDADFLTKALPRNVHAGNCTQIGLGSNADMGGSFQLVTTLHTNIMDLLTTLNTLASTQKDTDGRPNNKDYIKDNGCDALVVCDYCKPRAIPCYFLA